MQLAQYSYTCRVAADSLEGSQPKIRTDQVEVYPVGIQVWRIGEMLRVAERKIHRHLLKSMVISIPHHNQTTSV